MSFPRARTKRFNDVVSDAPAPTAYDPKLDVPPIGPASFYRGARFKHPAATTDNGSGMGSSEDCSSSGVGGNATLMAAAAASGHGSALRGPLGRSSMASGRVSSRTSATPRQLTPGRCRSHGGAAQAAASAVPAHGQVSSATDVDGRQQQQLDVPLASAPSPETVAGLQRELDAARSAASRDRAALVAEAERLRSVLCAREAELHEARSAADASERVLAASIGSSRTCIASLTEQLTAIKAASELSERREAEARCQAESLQGLLDGERLRAEREMDSLRTKLDAVVARCALGDSTTEPVSPDQCTRALQEYREALEEENQELQHDLRHAEELRQRDCDTIRALKGELFAADDYRRQAEEELLSLRRDLTDLCANVEALQESGIAAERALLSSNETCESLRKSLAVAEEGRALALKDLAVARAVLTDALEQCKAADESLAKSQEAGAAMQRQLQGEAERLRAQLTELELRVVAEAEQQERLRSAADARDGAMAELERRLAAEREAAARLAADLQAERCAVEQLKAERDEALRQLRSSEAPAQQSLASPCGAVVDPSSDDEVTGKDGATCATASTPERPLTEAADQLCDVVVVVTEDCVAPPPSSGGGSSGAGDFGTSSEQLAEAERRVSELELKLAEAEADMQRLRADCDRRQATSRDARAALAVESKYWKDLYEELHTKIEPFQEQLDAYEFERQALLSRSQLRADELTALSSEYAKLLGHQNQRQKIQHVVKIKDENRLLKKELEALKEEREKLKRALSAKDDKIRALEGRRRFDTTQAFKHGLETSVTSGSTGDSILKTPLKDCSNSVRLQKP